MSEVPQVMCFPPDDPGFAERVQSLLDGSDPKGPFAAAVESLLRAEYPLAVIHPRHELGGLDGGRVWYAFRDGSVVPIADGEAP